MKILLLQICFWFLVGLVFSSFLTWFFGEDVLTPRLKVIETANRILQTHPVIGKQKTFIIHTLGQPTCVVGDNWYFDTICVTFKGQICVKAEPSL